MPDKKTDSLDKRLSNWKVSLEGDPMLPTHVLNRISSNKHRSVSAAWIPAFRWAGGLAAVAALVVGAFMISQQLEPNRHPGESNYLLMIDPVSRIQTQSGDELTTEGDTLIERLAWMQDRYDLTQAQFLELVDLHVSYEERFDGLYEELVRLELRYEEFENLRRQNEMIDFIALYEVLKERKEMESSSEALSHELIGKVASLLRADQRVSYLSLVQSSVLSDA